MKSFALAESLAGRDRQAIIPTAKQWLDLVLDEQASSIFLTDTAYLAGQAVYLAAGEHGKARQFRSWYAGAPPLEGFSY